MFTSTGAPDFGRSLGWFSDHLRYWHSVRGHSCDILNRDVMAATMAHGAPYAFSNERWPYDAGVGIAIGGGAVFTDQWRSVLARGRPPPSSPLPQSYGKHRIITPIQGMVGGR